MPRKQYDDKAYVERGEAQDILDWADELNPPNRLYAITGSPGSGKSWLMAALYHRLQHTNRVLLWLDLSQEPVNWMNPGQPMDGRTDDGRRQWLQEAIAQARQKCPAVDYNETIAFAAMLESLVVYLCQNCSLSLPPLLLVDGFDEIEDETLRGEIELHMLRPFLRSPCTRLILARRDDDALNDPSSLANGVCRIR